MSKFEFLPNAKNCFNKIRHQSLFSVYCFYHKTTLCKG